MQFLEAKALKAADDVNRLACIKLAKSINCKPQQKMYAN